VQARLASVAGKADDVLVQLYQTLNASTREKLVELGSIQSRATLKALSEAVNIGTIELSIGVPTRAQLRSIVTTDPIRGAVMKDWWSQQRRATQSAFRREVRLGMSQGESLDELIRRVRGRSVGNGRYQGGVMSISTRNAGALVRTASNEIANRAAFETYASNPDVTGSYEYVAILDSRTTVICAALDGKKFRYDDPKAPRPPQHFGCRSTIVPVIDYKAVGITPPATARQTYPEWFDEQSAEVQDSILGPSRAALVRNGKASFADLLRADGSLATLDELEALLE
jgi:SPP1 gp7 family putative phage head morphogenesis protein